MPIKITNTRTPKALKHIKMSGMLKHPDRTFQQYMDGSPQEVYYINCGRSEPSLIVIWYDDESQTYRLSTDSIKDLKQFYPNVTAVDVTDNINIEITIS